MAALSMDIRSYVDLAYEAASRPAGSDPGGRLWWVEQIAVAADPWVEIRKMKSLLGI